MPNRETPPPEINADLNDWFKNLKQRALDNTVTRQQAIAHTPLIDKNYLIHLIDTWWENEPLVSRCDRYTIDSIIKLAGLEGKYRTSPAKRDVAKALRALGWLCKRDWTALGRNKRYWEIK